MQESTSFCEQKEAKKLRLRWVWSGLMRFACPHCGERGLEEFSYYGDATVLRPADGGALPSQAWTDYVYLRDNPAGLHRELWYHGAGCHAWLVVTRDLRDHRIAAVELARDVALARRERA